MEVMALHYVKLGTFTNVQQWVYVMRHLALRTAYVHADL